MSTPNPEIARKQATARQQRWRAKLKGVQCLECTSRDLYRANLCRVHYEAHQARKRKP